jgi:hypothetical protein
MSDWGLLDQDAALTHAIAAFPNLPIRVVGHSLGGHWLAFRDRIDRVARVVTVASGSAHWLAHPLSKLLIYLANPTGWEPRVPDEEEAQAALDLIRQEVHLEFHKLGTHRMIQDQLGDWRRAFELKGKGSTLDRARELRDIYDEAAPVPSAIISDVSASFLAAVRRIVDVAVENQRRVMTA